MYRLYVALTLGISMLLDSVIFAKVNIFGIVPDCVLAAVVCMGILLGTTDAALAGCLAGIVIDVLFGKAVGISSLAYMLAGMIGGIFYKKYFADNIFIPVATAAICAFFKENFMAVVTAFMGGSFNYFEMLATYIIPSSLMTAAICLPVYLYLKPRLQLSAKKRYDRTAGGVK